MIIRASAALSALRGATTPICPRSGRVQPCLPLALAHTFDVPIQTRLRWQTIRHSSDTHDEKISKAPKDSSVLKSSDDGADLSNNINPPESTLPAPLDIPARAPDQSFAGYWWKVGKAYWQFYKAGVKNINANRKAAAVLRQKAGQNEWQYWSGSREIVAWPSDATRAELLLLSRSRAEMKRVPVLIVLLTLFGEWTPVLALLMTPIVPYNCRIPRQIQKSRKKAEARRSKSFRGLFERSGSGHQGESFVPSPLEVKAGNITRDEALHIGRSLGLYGPWWDSPLLASVQPQGLVQRLLRHRLMFLHHDDMQLIHDATQDAPSATAPSQLRDEEARIAAELRGIDVLGRPIADIRGDLGLWLDISAGSLVQNFDPSRDEHSYTLRKRLLTRPNQWATLQRSLTQP